MKVKNLSKVINGALTLMVLAACTSGGDLPGKTLAPNVQSPAIQNPAIQNPGQQSQVPASNTATLASNDQASAALQSDLSAVHEDEAMFQDAQTVAAADGFSTQMLDSNLEVDAESEVGLQNPLPQRRPALNPIRRVLTPRQPLQRRKLDETQTAKAKANAQQNLNQRMRQMQKNSARMAAAAAIHFNADGTITLDPKLFKTEFHTAMDQKKDQFKMRLNELKPRLKAAHELAADKYKQLKRQNFVVRNSDKESVENEDGSITETMSIEFSNERTGVTRNIWLSKTLMNDIVVKVEFELDEKTPAFDRNATRIVTHHDDGSKTVLIESKTTWKNGKVREVNQERLIDAEGNVSGSGTITITDADGTVTTKDLSVSITPGGEMTTQASEEGSESEVTLQEDAAGDSTLIVEDEAGETEAVEVDLEAEAEAEASDSDDADETESDADSEDDSSDESENV